MRNRITRSVSSVEMTIPEPPSVGARVSTWKDVKMICPPRLPTG